MKFFLFGASLLMPLLVWPITHIGTRTVISEYSGFSSIFQSGKIISLETSPDETQVVARRIGESIAGGPALKKDIVVSELHLKLPFVADWSTDELEAWLIENEYDELEDINCFPVFAKTRGVTTTLIAFWGDQGIRGVHMSVKRRQLKIAIDFFKTAGVEGLCQR